MSQVTHDSSALFAGIPTTFPVVRYHSLAVRDLPPGMKATAWADDGVLMAVEDPARPAWGVQFHPESVCTAYGRELMTNFLAQSPQTEARPVIELAAREATVPSLTVFAERLDMEIEPAQAYERLLGDSRRAFWLDSSLPSHPLGAMSVIGDCAGKWGRTVTANVAAGTVTVDSETVHSGFFDWLEGDLASLRIDASNAPFGLGWVGYLGYELKAECGGSAAHCSELPDAMMMMFADRAVVFDHRTSEVFALVLEETYDAAGPALAELRAALRDGPAPAEFSPCVRAQPRHDRERYLELVAECQESIRQGESYEICLTNRIDCAGSIDPLPAYLALREASPAPFASFLRFDEMAVLSSSPERFLSISSAGAAESRPIKGTRPRGETPLADAALRDDLGINVNVKDRAENLMIVDLVRNDLGRSAVIGSVQVPQLFSVETYATVHQLVSVVKAQLRDDVSPVACVRAAFPGGSMTGAPKIRTMRIIDALEAGPRGIYSGAIGYFSPTGAVDLSIAIRTLVVTPDRAHFGTGGAVVALSDPAAEYQETVDKTAAIRAVLSLP
ncbi:aminodeoxychorismate synthase component I [Fodinicola feengrottensis]|uniref:aminodeoxychorismate synthase component I n=1 Tax=Fodinicola feengrottensis TaxID=435914 RepID=UPI0028BEB0E1|nr:aminodeoxychorismate synthase component I [Fodinicola feengrottensis]